MPTDHHSRLRSATDDTHRALTEIALHGHELIRRDEIPNGGDGYPPRASGAEPTHNGRVEVSEGIEVWPLTPTTWGWRCSCGDDLTCRLDGLPTEDSHPSSFAALRAGEQHLYAAHGTTRPIDYADPTGETVVNGHKPDPVHALVGKMLRAADSHARSLVALAAEIKRFLEEKPAESTIDDPGCESCARVGTWSPTRVTSDVGGRLKERRRLCRWCQDVVTATDALPAREILVAHHEGRRVRVSA